MAARPLVAWVERLSWMLIFAGLLALALGLAARDIDAATAWRLIVGGGVAAVIGVVLIWVRSRWGDAPP